MKANGWHAVVAEFMDLQRTTERARASYGFITRRRMAWYTFADGLLRDGLPRKPSVLTRPATLPDDDEALCAALRACKSKGEKAPKEAREIGRDFGAWIDAVAHAEARGAMAMELCLRALDVFADLAVNEHEPEAFVRAVMVADHIRDQWQVEPLPLLDPATWERVCVRANRRMDVIPAWLLNAETERPGVFSPEAWGA